MTDQLTKVNIQPFDYQYLKGLLREYRYPRNKISKMLKSGEIVALKSGLYVLAKRYGRSIVPETVANLLYGPSYVSLDYALAKYALIPELAYQVTSVTTGRGKIFSTEVGTYTYQHLKTDYYKLAYRMRKAADQGYLIASPEKALCDKLYLARRLGDRRALEIYLYEDLRIDYSGLHALDKRMISSLAETANKHNLRLLKELLS